MYPLDPLDEDTEHGVDMRCRGVNTEVLFILGSIAILLLMVGGMTWEAAR